MKQLLIYFFSLSITFVFSQNNQQELLVKHGINKKIIQGFEYQNDSLVKQTYLVDELDEFGNTISFNTYNMNDSLIRQTNYKFSEDGTTEFGRMLDKEGKLKYKMITIKNNNARSIRKMQINAKGDTLVEQIWIRDHNLNDSILYRVRNRKRTVSNQWHYNDGGMLLSKERFDKNGNLLMVETFTYQRKGNCIITKNQKRKVIWYKCIEGNKEIQKILRSREGYRSGIKLVSEKGGKKIETKLNNGLLEKIEYFSKKGKLLALIKYKYVNN
jgi:hypothetical protein